MRRAQTAIEFLVLVGFMLFIFTAFFLVIQERTASAKRQQYYTELSSIGDLLVQEVRLAQQVRNGYRREITLPSTVAGVQYNITLNDSAELTIRKKTDEWSYSDEEYLVFLPVNITVDGASNGVINPGKKYNITKFLVVTTVENPPGVFTTVTSERITLCTRPLATAQC